MIEFLPGEFVPVAEDADGFFYEARKGVHNLRPYHLAYGGIYVEKASPQRVWAYSGDARIGSKFAVKKDKMFLAPAVMRKFRAQGAQK